MTINHVGSRHFLTGLNLFTWLRVYGDSQLIHIDKLSLPQNLWWLRTEE